MGHLISVATETIMSNLSNCIFLSHARQKKERYSVGRHSLPKDRGYANDYVLGVRDQIKMIQYIRSRIGEDRDTVLDMGREPDDHRRERKPPRLSEGKSRAPGDVSRYGAEPAPKRARMTEARAQWSNSTATSESHFIPLTP